MHEDRFASPPLLTVFLVSSVALANEILLLRLFSISQFHHFAYMIISLALLGYGISGTILAFVQKQLLKHFNYIFIINVVCFGISIISCYLFASYIEFNIEELLWAPEQILIFFFLFLLLCIPFFFAANTIALTLSQFHSSISKIYAADLIGAGFGSIGILFVLFIMFPERAISILSSLAFLAAGSAWLELNLKPRLISIFTLFLSLIPLLLPSSFLKPQINSFKSLQQHLLIPGTSIIEEHSSPLGLLTLIDSKKIPLRYAPGLSFNSSAEIPQQLGLFTDGNGMTAIIKNNSSIKDIEFLDQTTTALPYHLANFDNVLILGAGGGMDVFLAKFHNASTITAVELNPQVVELARRYGGYNDHTKLTITIAEGRSFVLNSKDKYDLIQLSLLDTFSSASSGLYALNENFLYTVESFEDYLNHLSPDGFLCLTRWIRLPPRDVLKLFSTAVASLKKSGISNPESRLMLIRGWQTATLVVKNGSISKDEIYAFKKFCKNRFFDLGYYPDMNIHEANKINVLDRPYFFEAATALLEKDNATFTDNYKFNIKPATDNSPYFFRFFKWSSISEFFRLRGQGGIGLVEGGYIILLITLLQVLLISFLLIFIPVLLFRRKLFVRHNIVEMLRVFGCFGTLGLGFIFIEIAFMQKSILLLNNPLYATASIISGFLVFAGLGSIYSQKISYNFKQFSSGKAIFISICLTCIATYIIFDAVYVYFIGQPFFIRVLAVLVIIAPLAFWLGMPFPLALSRIVDNSPDLLPWAWAVNGSASVLSAVLATLIAIHAGYTTVIIAAIMLYITTAIIYEYL